MSSFLFGDPNDRQRDYLGTAKSLIGSSLMAAPVVAGLAYGSKGITSGDIAGIRGAQLNNVGTAAGLVGRALAQSQDVTNQIRAMKQRKLAEQFSTDSFIDDFLERDAIGKRQTLTGIIESINTLEGVDPTLKQTIVDIINQQEINLDTDKVDSLRRAFDSLKDQNPEFYSTINRNINFYNDRNVGSALTAPLEFKGKPTQFSSVTAPNKIVSARANRIKAILGDSATVNIVEVNESLGGRTGTGFYAQITGRGSQRSNMLALDLSGVIEGIGSPIARVGHAQQAIAMPIAIGNASAIQSTFLQHGKTFGAQDIMKGIKGNHATFRAIEDYQIDLLERAAGNKIGKSLRVGDMFRDLNSDLRGLGENVNRTFGGLSNQAGLNRYQAFSSRIAFDVSDLNRQSRKGFVADVLGSHTDTGIITGHTNLQISTLNNLSTVSLSLKHGVQLGVKGFTASGIEDTFSRYGFQPDDIKHSLLPLTARPKQYFNLENFFVKKEGKGFTLSDKRQDRALMILDMKEGRLGLSEGELYLGGNSNKTLKIFPKTVMNPKGMNVSGNVLLNTLIERSNRGMDNLVIKQNSKFEMFFNEDGKTVKKMVGIGRDAEVKFDNIGDFYRKMGMGSSGGLFLGKMDGKQIEVPFYRGIQRLELGIAERTTGTGADLLRIVGSAVLDDKYPKVFAEHVKGTAKHLDADTLHRMSMRYQNLGIGMGGFDMVSFGNNKTQALNQVADKIGATTGSMLNKAPYYHATQMLGATEAYAALGGLDGESTITKVVNRVRSSHGDLGRFNTVREQQRAFTTAVIESISDHFIETGMMRKAKERQLINEQLGRIFGGFNSIATTSDPDKVMSGLVRADLEKTLTGKFGSARFKEIQKEIEKGLVLSLTHLRPGPDLATARSSAASSEARYLNFLGAKLSQVAGMGTADVADVLHSVLSRKSDAGNEMTALKEYMRFHQYARSQESILDAKLYRDMDRIGLDKFSTMTKQEIEHLLSSRESGFLLEFGEGTSASKALNKVFKGKGSLYIPAGKAFLESIASQSTDMVKVGETVRLDAEYKKQLHYFSENISGFMNPSQTNVQTIEEAEKVTRGFQRKISEISSTAFKNMLRGKLSGSANLRAAGLKLLPMTDDTMSGIIGKELASKIRPDQMLRNEVMKSLDMSKKEMDRLNVVSQLAMKKRNTQVAFMEGEAFLASMTDFISGSKREYLGNLNQVTDPQTAMHVAAGKAKADAADKFKQFFLGGYESYAKSKYSDLLTGIISRQPILASGHVQLGTILRHTKETLGEDAILKNIIGSTNEDTMKQVRQMQRVFGSEVFEQGSFEKLANIASNKMSNNQVSTMRNFFGYMAENISKFQNSDGGGRIFFPDMEVRMHYKDASGKLTDRTINLGLAQAAIGDFDGDQFQVLFTSKSTSDKINSGLLAKGAKNVHTSEMMQRIGLRMIFDEAGEGIKNMADTLGKEIDLNPTEYLKGIAEKEIMGKDVGRIDVALDALRLGMVNTKFSQKEMHHVQNAMSLLAALEEVGTIKAKKLPKALPIGDAIARAANLAYEGDSSDLRRVVKQIFQGTSLQDGFQLHGLDITTIADKNTRSIIESAYKQFKGNIVDFDQMFDIYDRSAVTGKRIGAREAKTASGIGKTLSVENEFRGKNANFSALMYETMQARLVHGASDDEILRESKVAFGNILNRFHGLQQVADKRMLGPGIAGIGGALALVGALSSGGYDPKPMLMPGEITDPGIGRAIAAGNMFDNRGASVNNSNYSHESVNMNERPITVGETYVRKNDSFIMNGRLPNTDSIVRVQQMMQSLGGSASFAINDTRGPVTMNFINRYMDE